MKNKNLKCFKCNKVLNKNELNYYLNYKNICLECNIKIIIFINNNKCEDCKDINNKYNN